MVRQSKTTVKELTAQYRSVLKKCAFLNAIVIMGVEFGANASVATVDAFNWTDLKNNLENGQNVVLKDNILVPSNLEIRIGAGDVTSAELDASNFIITTETDITPLDVFNVINNAQFTVNNLTINNTKFLGDGSENGAVKTDPNAHIIFNGTTNISGNNAKFGTALYNNGNMLFNGVATFKNNTADSHGGVIMNQASGTINFKEATQFENNISKNTGIIYNNGGDITFDKKAEFTSNKAQNASAIFGTSGNIDFKDEAIFKNNTVLEAASDGAGTVFNDGANIAFDKVTFENNTAKYGSAIVSLAGSTTIKNDAKFSLNVSTSGSGAIYNSSNFVINDTEKQIENVVFQENQGNSSGAAIYNDNHFLINAKNITFDKNSNAANYGGAVFNSGDFEIIGDKIGFTNNTALATYSTETEKKYFQFGGGAIQNRGNTNETTLVIGKADKSTNITFENNHSAQHGGAIYSRAVDGEGKDSTVTINGTTNFIGNTADYNGGAIGNYNKTVEGVLTGGNATFTFNGDTTFKDNIAGKAGGAIYNTGAMTFNGNTTFTNNAVTSGLLYPGGAVANFGTMNFHGNTIFANNTYNFFGVYGNDIYNDGVINFDGNVTLDTATLGSGTINFYNGTALTSTLDKTIISGGEVNFAGNNTINMIVENTADAGEHNFINSSTIKGVDKVEVKNDLYNMTLQDDGKINVAVKSGEELLADTPASLQEANTISALVATSGEGTVKGNAIANQISTLMQTGQKDAAVKLAEEVAPTTSQTVMGVAQSVNSVLANVAGARMAAVGHSGGDAFVGGSVWAQGLMNHTKQNTTDDYAGFSANTAGVSLGVDGKITNSLMIGIGYGYTNTKADSGSRDIDVDGHNIFAYTEYKPNDWYINGMFSYGINKYDEHKLANLGAKYDVNTYAANVMTGYDFDSGITPEIGLRYLLADQKSYNDGMQNINADKTDVLTGVAGVKYKTEMKANDWTFAPNLRLAATYDMISDDSIANVSVIGGGNYQITGKSLERLGVEAGIGLETTYKDWTLSINYNGGFRKDFQSHTGMLKAKYNF